MGVALFMTVGTGRGTEESIKSLAHGVLSAIIHYNPKTTIFFGSDESNVTIDSLKEQYREEKKKELTDYEFITINDVDDFDECFSRIRKKIGAYEGYAITIDYTSGTKTMTMSAAICSMLYHKRLNLISGKRGGDGSVIPGTESQREQNLYPAYDKLLFDRVKDMFNSYRFEEARSILNQIVILDEKGDYERMIDAYDQWDRFNHLKAFEMLKDIRDDGVSQNKAFLGELVHRKDNLEYFIIDLINNASRRIEEEKYDDAAARLYRTIELIAQARLADMNLIDKKRFRDNMVFAIRLDALKERLDDETVHKYCDGQKKEDMEKNIIKLSLYKNYALLYDLDYELGVKFNGDKHLQTLLQSRNNSILAHGLRSVEKDVAKDLFEKAIEYTKVALLDELMEEAKFHEL